MVPSSCDSRPSSLRTEWFELEADERTPAFRVFALGISSNRLEYSRHRNLVNGLRQLGGEVDEHDFPLLPTFATRLGLLANPFGFLNFMLHCAATFAKVVWRYLEAPRFDVILVGYPAFFYVHLARLLAWFSAGRPAVVYDAFVPLFESIVIDRQIVPADGWRSRLIRALEGHVLEQADLCLVDTIQHRQYLSTSFGISPSNLVTVYPGAIGSIAATPIAPAGDSEVFDVVFVGTYSPLHGIRTILRAAARLRNDRSIRITLVGTGQLRVEMETYAQSLQLGNLRFQDWVEPEELPTFLRRHHLMLGIFGTTEKADRVVPLKVIEGCAAGVPIVTAETAAIRSLFHHRENAFLIPAGAPAALARAIRLLKADPELQTRIATGALRLARQRFRETVSCAALVDRLKLRAQASA